MGIWNKLANIGKFIAPILPGGGYISQGIDMAQSAGNKIAQNKQQKQGLGPSNPQQMKQGGGFLGGMGKRLLQGGMGGGQFPGMTPPYAGGGQQQNPWMNFFNQMTGGGQQPQQGGMDWAQMFQGNQNMGGGQAQPRGPNMRTPNLANPIQQGANEGRARLGLGPRQPTMF